VSDNVRARAIGEEIYEWASVGVKTRQETHDHSLDFRRLRLGFCDHEFYQIVVLLIRRCRVQASIRGFRGWGYIFGLELI
jgi:hypothetical protein